MPDPQLPTTIASGVQGGLSGFLNRLNRFVKKPPQLGVYASTPPAEMGQGTRAPISMGHYDTAGLGLYEPWAMTQFGIGGPEYTNAPQRFQTVPWNPNPSTTEENVNANRRYLQREMDQGLQQGPAPGRIIRYMPWRIYGVDGAATGVPVGGEWDGGSLAFETGWQYMPHYKVIRQALGTKGPQKLADDNAAIPAIFAGNPRP